VKQLACDEGAGTGNNQKAIIFRAKCMVVPVICGCARRGHGHGFVFRSDPTPPARLDKLFCIRAPEVIVASTVGAKSEVFQSRNFNGTQLANLQ